MRSDWLSSKQEHIRRRWQELGTSRVAVERQALDLDRAIDAWHDGDGITATLPEFLGLTAEEYATWVRDGVIPAHWQAPNIEDHMKGKRETVTTTSTANSLPVDEDGYIDLSHQRLDYQHLMKLIEERRLIDEAIAEYERRFKTPVAQTVGAIGFKIDGIRRATYRPDGPFQVAKFRQHSPHLVAAYTKTEPVFDLETFKQHNPELYNQWRSRSFRHVTGTKG